MRRLPNRSILPVRTQQLLQEKTLDIVQHNDPVARAAVVYSSSRSTVWFASVTDALRGLAGPGERCMFCSGSESSQVEHFRPKETFPQDAMIWPNFLWVCGLCNNSKGIKFPVLADGSTLINPLEEDVWEYFFIDHFGNLSERWRMDLNALDPRARMTVRTLGLDRDALQFTRRARLKNLRELVESAVQCLGAELRSKVEVRASFEEWKGQPLQSDVADYFLAGPGREEEPFKSLIEMME